MSQALVFDLDGTLIDSAPDLHQALLRLLAEEGRAPISLADMTTMVGDGAAALVERVFAHAGRAVRDELPEFVARYLAHYGNAVAVHTRPYPGVSETLERLQQAGHRMAVCTNKADRPVVAVLEALGLSRYFDAVVGGDSAHARKPDAKHVLTALDRLAARPAGAVMIGDGDNDLLAAQAAGVPVIHARYGYGISETLGVTPDAVVDEFSAIPAALKAIAGTGRQ